MLNRAGPLCQAIRYRIIDTPAARGGQVCLGPKHEAVFHRFIRD